MMADGAAPAEATPERPKEEAPPAPLELPVEEPMPAEDLEQVEARKARTKAAMEKAKAEFEKENAAARQLLEEPTGEDAGPGEDRAAPAESALTRLEACFQEHLKTALKVAKSIDAKKRKKGELERKCEEAQTRALRTRATSAKMAALCEDMHRDKHELAQAVKRIPEEEAKVRKELIEKFDGTIAGVEEKINSTTKDLEPVVEENKYLRERLEKFKESYESREASLNELARTGELEMENKRKILADIEEHWIRVKKKAKEFQKEHTELSEREKELRAALEQVADKFSDFQGSLDEKNQGFNATQAALTELQRRQAELEPEVVELLKRDEHKDLVAAHQEKEKAYKQAEALGRLSGNLENECQALRARIQESSIRARLRAGG